MVRAGKPLTRVAGVACQRANDYQVIENKASAVEKTLTQVAAVVARQRANDYQVTENKASAVEKTLSRAVHDRLEKQETDMIAEADQILHLVVGVVARPSTDHDTIPYIPWHTDYYFRHIACGGNSFVYKVSSETWFRIRRFRSIDELTLLTSQ
ncbi:hypothetical protein vseg_013028 [Gypsophila vaccaria]